VLPSGELRLLWAIAGATAAVLTSGGVLFDRRLIVWGVVVLGTAYLGRLFVDGAPLDPGAAVFGAGLLVSSELAHQSGSLGEPGSVEPELAIERQVALIVVVLTGLAVGSVALLAATVSAPASAAITALGAAAAAGALWLLAWLARTSEDR
jgi:hypothetical protein